MDETNTEKTTGSNKWLLAVPVTAAFLAVLVWIVSGSSMLVGNNNVLSNEAVSPLGVPSEPESPAPPRPEGVLELNGVKAKSFLVYDVESETVLAEREPEQPVAIASVTKLMTGLVVYNTLPTFKETITITAKDTFSIEPVLGLTVADRVQVADLFYAMLVGSANDAALALANHVEAKTNQGFIDQMNNTAEELGMENTHFSNPLGFDSEANYSTASDLKKLISVIQEHQAFGLVARSESYTFTSETGIRYSVKATNKLVAENEDLYAIKTGFTNLAQGAMITETKNDGHPFVIIVLDSTDRESDTLLLLSEIRKKYVW